MKNVTISLREPVIKMTRLLAAKKNVSLSRFIGQLLEEITNREGTRKNVLKAFLSQEAYLQTKGKTFKRDEIYDRKVLR